jgi:large subunit ribosomal protein L14
MIAIESKLKSADNAGAIVFKCIAVYDGFRRRYARLGERVGSVAQTRRVYRADTNKKILDKKVKKKRKQKSKKVKPYIRPYLTLLVGVKKPTNRKDGSYIRFDENRVLTFLEPKTFGSAGKYEDQLPFLGSKIFGPVCREIFISKKRRENYSKVIPKAKGVI